MGRFDRMIETANPENAKAQAEYDRTGQLPKGFKMVFGKVVKAKHAAHAAMSWHADSHAHAAAKHALETGNHPFKAGSPEHEALKIWATGDIDKVKEFSDTNKANWRATELVWGQMQHLGADMAKKYKAFGKAFESRFDRAAGLVEDHDPADGVTLRELHTKLVSAVAACKSAKSMDECVKHCSDAEAALAGMKTVVDRL